MDNMVCYEITVVQQFIDNNMVSKNDKQVKMISTEPLEQKV